MWLTALIMGVAGSLHCAGMCSPLMMAVSNQSTHGLLNRLAYNSGRIFTYGILGSIVSGFSVILPIEKYQNIFSILLGVTLVLIALLQFKMTFALKFNKVVTPFTNFLKNQFAFFMKEKDYVSVVFLGMINGMLPCGISFLALSYCLTLQGPLDGLNFMILFGIGTLPVMLGVAPILFAIVKKLSISFQKLTVTLVGISGLLLIVRVFLHAGMEASKHGRDFVDVVLCR